jgi:hypothetical protein
VLDCDPGRHCQDDRLPETAGKLHRRRVAAVWAGTYIHPLWIVAKNLLDLPE